MSAYEVFYAFMSLLSALILVGVHVYIKNKLRSRHDNGLLFAAGAMFVWLPMAIWEWHDRVHNHPPYSLEIRKFISIINTGLFLSSLIYFKDSWYKVNKNLENIQYHLLALISTVLLLIAYVFIPQKDDWSYFEGWVSIVVAILLSSSMSVTLYFREDESEDKKMSLLFFIPLIAGVLLIFAQVFDKDFGKHYGLDSILDENFYLAFRMLSRPMLVISYLLVAMTWLHKNQYEINILESVQPLFDKPSEPVSPNVQPDNGESEEVTEGSIDSSNDENAQNQPESTHPDAVPQQNTTNQPLINRIAFIDKDMAILITFQSDDTLHFNNALIRFGLSRVPYKLLKECAQKTKEFGAFRYYPPSQNESLTESEREFEGKKVIKVLNDSSNASEDLAKVIAHLNSGKVIRPHGRNVLPDSPLVRQTFFISMESNGEYRLPFAPENIVFDTRNE
jgi:hypothetical protein